MDRRLNKHEVAAMWLFSEEYADLGLGAIAYFAGLSTSDKQLVRRMVRDIEEAPEPRRGDD